MKIFLACPAPARSRKGNRVTALRWAHILKSLGHQVRLGTALDEFSCDLLVALHARRSHEAVRRFRQLFPAKPLIVALTGTDLYRDIHTSRIAQQSLELADRLIVLQARGGDELPVTLRRKVRVIYQSARRTPVRGRKRRRFFDVCVLGHLRSEKDPFRTALATQLLPATSKIQVTHAGEALSPTLARRASRLMSQDPRYRWVGEVPRWRARRILARSRLLVLSSIMEGGANVLSEAIVDGVPVLASRIAGSIGILGADYPGFFDVGDTRALAGLLTRAESDGSFYNSLGRWSARLAPQFRPSQERLGWRRLLQELTADPTI
jgi:putative glycosyltransferase (TIGR04348 family)